jgi:hypothetical protein
MSDGRGFDDVVMHKGIGEGLFFAAVGWKSDIAQVILEHSEVSQEAMDRALLGTLREECEYDDFYTVNPVSR